MLDHHFSYIWKLEGRKMRERGGLKRREIELPFSEV